MHDGPGVSTASGSGNDHDDGIDEHEVCEHCDSPLEWTLRLDGVTERQCPKCDKLP